MPPKPKPTLEETTQIAKQEKKQKLQQALDAFKDGMALMKGAGSKKELADAVELFSTAIALRPNVFRYFSVRGGAYRALGQYQRAFFDYSAAARIAPTNAMNYCNRAITLRKLKRYQEALGDLERAVELEPSNAVYSFNRGLVYFEMGSYDAAIAEFTATILADKLLYKAYFNRANCYRRVGRLEEAVTDLRIAVGLDSSLATGHNSLGLALCELGRYEDAGKSMDAAVEKASANATYLCNRGLVRYHLGRVEDAIHDLNDALKHCGDDVVSYFHRGNALLAAGKPDDAIDDLTQALTLFLAERSTDNAATAGSIAAATLFAKASAAAVAAGAPTKALRRGSVVRRHSNAPTDDDSVKPSAASARKGSALTASTASGSRRASESMLKAIQEHKSAEEGEMKGTEGVGHPRPAGDVMDDNEDDAAATQHDKASSGTSDEKSLIGDNDGIVRCRILHSLGLAFQAASQYEEALSKFNEALTYCGSNLASRYHAGLMYFATQRYREADAAFTAVIDVDCDEPHVREARGLAYQAVHRHEDAIGDFSAAIALQTSPSGHTIASSATLGFNVSIPITDVAKGETLYHRAMSYIETERPSDALADLKQALALGYDVPEVHDAAASAHLLTGSLGSAVADYNGALAVDPGNPDLLCKRAQAFLKLQNYEAAEVDLAAALRKRPGDPVLLYLRGLALYELDKFEAAIVDFKSALRHDPPVDITADCHYHVGLAFANSDQHPSAVLAFNMAVLTEPPRPPATMAMYKHERAKSLQMCGRFAEAIEDFTAVLSFNPQCAHAFFRRGFAHKAMKAYELAANDFESARLLQPDNPNLVVNYSRLHEIDCIVLCAAGEEPM